MVKNLRLGTILLLISSQLVACADGGDEQNYLKSETFLQMNQGSTNALNSNHNSIPSTLDTATFGAGCFWCTEAQFQQLKGVQRVESGYSGGTVKDPSYKEVSNGNTGHAEVSNIYYNPKEITYDELLAAFWQTHDPTQLNRQGNDVGTQYRSVIFYHNVDQKNKAEQYKTRLNLEHAFGKDIVTEISPATTFYKAEEYHQNYYNQNANQPYCQFVVKPKLDKFKKVFQDKLAQ